MLFCVLHIKVILCVRGRRVLSPVRGVSPEFDPGEAQAFPFADGRAGDERLPLARNLCLDFSLPDAVVGFG